jgi:hypothetical protein
LYSDDNLLRRWRLLLLHWLLRLLLGYHRRCRASRSSHTPSFCRLSASNCILKSHLSLLLRRKPTLFAIATRVGTVLLMTAQNDLQPVISAPHTIRLLSRGHLQQPVHMMLICHDHLSQFRVCVCRPPSSTHCNIK